MPHAIATVPTRGALPRGFCLTGPLETATPTARSRGWRRSDRIESAGVPLPLLEEVREVREVEVREVEEEAGSNSEHQEQQQ